MFDFIEIIKTILPVILVLAIGILCRNKNLLSREGVNALKNVAVNIALPAVMLNAFATMDYTVNNIIITLMMFVACLAAWFLGKAAGKVLHLNSRFVAFLTTGFEAGMLGYALFGMLYGTERTADFACIDLGQVLFVFTLYKILLGMDGKEKPTAKSIVSEMLHSPTFVAIVIGVLLGATGLYHALEPSGISSILDACTDFISKPTSVMILIAIGYDLVLTDVPWGPTCKVVGLRLVIMGVLRVLLGLVLQMLGADPGLGQALNVMLILPPPYVLPVFADDEDQRTYISSALSVSTVVAIIGFIVLAAIK